VKKQLIIEEELALLKAKHKIPSRSDMQSKLFISIKIFIGKQSYKSREKGESIKNNLSKEEKEDIQAKLDELKPEKENFFDKRDERKHKEDERK